MGQKQKPWRNVALSLASAHQLSHTAQTHRLGMAPPIVDCAGPSSSHHQSRQSLQMGMGQSDLDLNNPSTENPSNDSRLCQVSQDMDTHTEVR